MNYAEGFKIIHSAQCQLAFKCPDCFFFSLAQKAQFKLRAAFKSVSVGHFYADCGKALAFVCQNKVFFLYSHSHGAELNLPGIFAGFFD